MRGEMFPRLRSFVTTLVLRDRFEDSLDEEVRFHIEAQTEDLVCAGVPLSEAACRARMLFGSIESVKDDCRRARGLWGRRSERRPAGARRSRARARGGLFPCQPARAVGGGDPCRIRRNVSRSATSGPARPSRRRRGTPGTRQAGAAAMAISRLALVDISLTGPLLSSFMSVIAQAIADRQSEIDHLQAEIKALTDVEQILTASAPPSSRSTSRRSSSTKKPATAAGAESKSDAKPERKRRPMTAAEKKAVSERMTAYWAERRKQAAKKKRPAKK